MVSRWFQVPRLHTPKAGRERKVGWLELFYDLVYVATIIQLGSALSNSPSLTGALGFAGLMIPIWFSWTGFTFYSNRFVVDDIAHRGLVFVQMFAIAAVAVSIPGVFEGRTAPFALSYAAVRLVLALMYARTWWQLEEGRAMTGRYALGFAAGVLLWAASALVTAPWVFVIWALALVWDLSVPLARSARALITRHPPDVLHMSERYGILTLIVLGESFVKVLTDLADRGASPSSLAMGAMLLLVVCSLWWIYFDDVAGSRIRAQTGAPLIWVYSHLPLAIAITGVGVAVKKAIAFVPDEPAPDKYRWLLCGMLSLAMLAVGAIDSVTERRQAELSDRARVNMRLATALVLLLVALTGRFMPAWTFLLVVTAIALAQVVFDLSMAPAALDPHAAHHDAQRPYEQPAAGIGLVTQTDESLARPRRDVSEAVHKNTPSQYRRDFYFWLIEGSWLRLFSLLVVAYFSTNLIFASLFLIEPGAIANAQPGSFSDAFFFSVQTMSTIGYGAMAPGSRYGHILVTIEAAVGLLGVALATGVMFSKLSRPRSSILFTEVVVVTRQHDRPVLMLRLGNARGNDVVEVTARVVVLKEEVSPEGHRMRRFHDLVLERDTTPIFALTWTLMHVIDEKSPLHGIGSDQIEREIVLMMVTLTGFDGTYAQTIHARKNYFPEQFRFNQRLVDVISTLPDGRLEVDYDRFHETTPDDGSAHEPEAA
jgi:inward rectifier potassium channel